MELPHEFLGQAGELVRDSGRRRGDGEGRLRAPADREACGRVLLLAAAEAAGDEFTVDYVRVYDLVP